MDDYDTRRILLGDAAWVSGMRDFPVIFVFEMFKDPIHKSQSQGDKWRDLT